MRAGKRYKLMVEALTGATLTLILDDDTEYGPIPATVTELAHLRARVSGSFDTDGPGIYPTAMRINYTTGTSDEMPVELEGPHKPRTHIQTELILEGDHPDWEDARFRNRADARVSQRTGEGHAACN